MVGRPVLVDVSVVIPTLNEAGTIGTCIEKVKRVFEECDVDGEIVVSDSSNDETASIAKSLGAKVVTPDKRGYGYAYLYGFKHVSGRYIVMGDGDDTYDFLELPKLLKPLLAGESDLVLGSRFKGGIEKGAMPWLHRYIGNPLLTWFLNLFFSAGVSDAHCGLRAISRDALDRLELYSSGMEFASEMIIMAAMKDIRMMEVPISYHPRRGNSKLSSFNDGWRHMKFMLLYAPTSLYLIPGLTLFSLGWLMMFLSFFGLDIGFIPSTNSLIFSSFSVIMGFQVVYLGLFAKLYLRHEMLKISDRVSEFVLRHLSLEKGIAVGALLFLGGLGYIGYLILIWVKSGYRILPLIGESIVGLTFLTLGLQIFFNSFFLSMLAER